jgi:hypothetical protein
VGTFRREAGRKLADSGLCKVNCKIVTVPSRSQKGLFHFVNMRTANRPRCGCKDNVVGGQICAHIWAARTILDRLAPDADPQPKLKEKIYPRNWAAYNEAEVSSPAIARRIFAYLAINLMDVAGGGA